MRLDELPTPALLLDLDRLESNIRRMSAKAERLGVSLRPHIKTHKAIEIARLQREHGARGITVSTLHEARVFAEHGFDDITWAFPVILGRIPEAVELSERVDLGLLVDSGAAIDALEATRQPLGVYLKIDCGYHRAGVSPAGELVHRLAERLIESSSLTFRGILTHAGHAYEAAGPAAVEAVARQERDVMVGLAERLRRTGLPVPIVSIGSTPTMSVVRSLAGIDEIRPGNYVFYDRSQVVYGSCSAADCALSVLTTVVSSQPGARYSVVDAGALALSKDPGAADAGPPSFGAVYVEPTGAEIDESLWLTGLSQEHGMLNAPLPVGTRIRVLPNHSCLTAAQFDEYQVVRGDRVVDRWAVERGR
jgi:D-serine deaminase-like pyridoxal phosphate-dependent protein